MGQSPDAPTPHLLIQVQGLDLVFLVDFRSTHSFIDSELQDVLTDIQQIKPVSVTIAGGGSLHCGIMLKQCPWNCNSIVFRNYYIILPLANYDGILGSDYLALHSPMQIDWAQK